MCHCKVHICIPFLVVLAAHFFRSLSLATMVQTPADDSGPLDLGTGRKASRPDSHLMGPPGPLWAGPLWSPLCPYGPRPHGLPGPLWAGPLWAPLGSYGPGPYGTTWALMGRALMGPLAPYGPGPNGPLG